MPSVYENGLYRGGAERLSDIPISIVIEIERLSSIEAKVLFGASCQCDGGVISVKTKP
jgi:hypothetical protein